MVSPALYNFRNTGFLLDKSEDKADDRQPDFVHSQGDFPQLGEKPVGKDGHTVIVRIFAFATVKDSESNTMRSVPKEDYWQFLVFSMQRSCPMQKKWNHSSES